MTLPYDGAISDFHKNHASQSVRDAIAAAPKSKQIANPDYPYPKRMSGAHYRKHMADLQQELAKFHNWIKTNNKRVVVVFEGRDAAGKGGTIKRLCENLSPRQTSVVALSKPTEREAGQWYFQRYVKHMPTAGTMTIFDRSWYNRAVVETVFGFCAADQRAKFMDQVVPYEQMLVQEGISLVKIWLNIGQAEQLRRFLARESDPLKQWKLSRIDVDGLHKWDAYSDAILDTLSRTDHADAPWAVVRSDDKRRARIAALQQILSRFDYAGHDLSAIGDMDPLITGGPEVWHV